MRYVVKVRSYAETMPVEGAVECAIEECVRDDILADFLRKHRAEAKNVSIFEYDEERHMEMERKQHREEGREEGREENRIEKIKKKVEKGIDPVVIAEHLEEPEAYVMKICELLVKHPECTAQELYEYYKK